MKLTKFTHACVLVEHQGRTALIDPGDFSLQAGVLKVHNIRQLDYVLITHEHFDHFNIELAKQASDKFPDVKFISTEEVAKILQDNGINNVSTVSDANVVVSKLGHDSMAPLRPEPMCDNISLDFLNLVTHPGDSHHLKESCDVLLLPVDGPWGSTVDAVRMAIELKPKYILPIHDWMWNDQWKLSMYGRLAEFFEQNNINFII